VLLDDYETGMTAARLDGIFEEARPKGSSFCGARAPARLPERFRGLPPGQLRVWARAAARARPSALDPSPPTLAASPHRCRPQVRAGLVPLIAALKGSGTPPGERGPPGARGARPVPARHNTPQTHARSYLQHTHSHARTHAHARKHKHTHTLSPPSPPPKQSRSPTILPPLPPQRRQVAGR
jgi:hypothetical protein